MNKRLEEYIGFDIDGVLADTLQASIIYAHREYGVDFQRKDVTQWSMHKCTGLTKKQEQAMYVDPEFYRDIPVVSEAVQVVWQLMSYFNGVYLTARPLNTYNVTRNWLEDNLFPELPLISEPDKVKFIKAYKLDYLVEDNLETVIAASAVLKKAFLCSYDYLYNQGDVPKNVIRIATLWDVVHNLQPDIPCVCPTCGRFHSEQD